MRLTLQILSTWSILLLVTVVTATGQVQVQQSSSRGSMTSLQQPRALPSTGFSTSVLAHATTDNILIPSAKADPNTMAQLGADLRIMCRIFDKTVTRKQRSDMMDIYDDMYGAREMDIFTRSMVRGGILGSYLRESTTKALYVDGYGVLFFVNVRFPLGPTPEMHTESVPPEDADPVWREARQEIFEPGRSRKQTPRSVYDATTVEQLKGQIRTALQHASNIRGIDADEHLTVVVNSHAGVSAESASSVTTLTLRARKRDVDALAAGQLTKGQFEQRVELIEL